MRHLQADLALTVIAPGAAGAPPASPRVLPYLAAAAVASTASVRVADPMLPALAHDFGIEPAGAVSTVTAFALAYGLMQLAWGPLGDRLGKLRVIAWAACAAALGSAACALAPSLGWLTAARIVTGASCAAIIPLSIAWIGDTVDYGQRQATLARFAAGSITGLIVGQVAGGVFADTLGWRAAFAALAVAFVATGGAAMRLVRRDAGARAAAPGAGPGAPAARPGTFAAYRSVLSSGWSRTVFAIAAVEGALVYGVLALAPTWLHDRGGLSLAAAGGVLAAVGAGGLAYASTAHRWLARLGERDTAAVGAAAVAAGFAALALVAPRTGAALGWVAALACAVAGFGFYMLHGTLQTLATQLAPQARATAIGLFAVALFAGQAAGVAAAADLGAATGYEAVFVGCAVLVAALGAGLRAALGRRARGAPGR